MIVTCARPWLVADLGAPHRVISWAVHRPGLVTADRIIWREVRDADLTPGFDAGRWLAAELGLRGGTAVGLLTSRDLRFHHAAAATVDGITVSVLATAGLSNAEAAGARLAPGAAHWGTINLAVQTSTPLSDPALYEALSIIAQARTAAVMDHGPELPTGRATGTGTDCIALAVPPGPGLPHAGLHTALGEALGRAVRQATAAAVIEWMAKVRPTLRRGLSVSDRNTMK